MAFVLAPPHDLIWVGHGMVLINRVGGGASNFQTTMAARVGVLGLILGYTEPVKFAINGAIGFAQLMNDGILKNGLWSEGSVSYSKAVVG